MIMILPVNLYLNDLFRFHEKNIYRQCDSLYDKKINQKIV